MLNGLIIEDVITDAKALQQCLKEIQPELICEIIDDGMEAVNYIQQRKTRIDVFFIDRELPQVDGFTLASKIRDMEEYVLAPIIFVTGFSMGQLDAFHEYHCYSYLTKPVSRESVEKGVGKLLLNLGRERKEEIPPKVVSIKVGNDFMFVDIEQIIGIEVMGKNSYLYTTTSRLPLMRQTLEQVLNEINEPHIIRCHKSFAINVKYMKAIQKERRNLWKPVFSIDTNFDCAMSKTYYDQVLEQYQKYRVK